LNRQPTSAAATNAIASPRPTRHGHGSRSLGRERSIGGRASLGRRRNSNGQIDRGFINQLQRPHRHAHQTRSVFDQGRFHPFGHHADAFVDIGNDAAVGVKEPRIVHDDGGFAQSAHEIQRLGHGAVAGFGPPDHFHQRHLVDRREEMHPDHLFRPA
jgi:hypothetical protein